ncbi:MAG: hypothetical protein COA96_11475 [SAR86 cluster bacterium]|uniref:Uncharacterized protein n=1 Tax=SAR86 cluster bacterium TaxID=2030880 RepID=A0A2A5AWE8_9GAMM|nr:MAG: hypothetical protein COA96_11475 [SAR86 cluster bacterium]
MKRFLAAGSSVFICAISVFLVVPSMAQRLEIPDYEPIDITILKAEEIARFEAPEAIQGAAADADYFYAIVNTVIGKYEKTSGELVDRWTGPRGGPIQHVNSCYVEFADLFCVNSNYPDIPMASSIEIFDTATMEHKRTFSLGLVEEGSITWFDHLGTGWIAGFAQYDGRGGLDYKDHTFSSISRYDSSWRRVGGWMIPQGIIERMTPMAASGGSVGPDGLLYLTGHDLPEMYVLAAPSMGPTLVHIATIEIDAPGQAFSWDKSSNERIVYGISRPDRQVRSFKLPEIELPKGVYRLNSAAVLEPAL